MSKDLSSQKSEIMDQKDKLIKMLGDFSKNQVELWRQVPELAKEADRLNRFGTGRFKLAHSCHLWAISPRFLNGLQVDLRTGVVQSGPVVSLDSIEFGQVSSILEQLDAAEVIKLLKEVIRVFAGDRTRLCQGQGFDLGGTYEV